jgi:hypothetical protein
VAQLKYETRKYSNKNTAERNVNPDRKDNNEHCYSANGQKKSHFLSKNVQFLLKEYPVSFRQIISIQQFSGIRSKQHISTSTIAKQNIKKNSLIAYKYMLKVIAKLLSLKSIIEIGHI